VPNLHNTLYVTSEGAYVSKSGESAVVKVDGAVRMQVPLHHLSSVVCFGWAGVSPELMAACAEAGVSVAFLSPAGRFLARVEGPLSGNVLLRRAQYRAADDAKATAALSRAFVAGKIANSRSLLQRALRDRPDRDGADAIADAIDHIRRLAPSLLAATDVDVVRGIEGDSAARYFRVFDHLILANKAAFPFSGRTRRPARDPVNAMLSFGYALLLNDCLAAATAAGLDGAVGFLHRDRPGRPSLALDLMEELRSVVVDRLVLSLVNLGQVSADGFTTRDTGAVEMDEATRKTFLVAYQKRKQEELKHPVTGAMTTWAVIPHIQARLLARVLRGDWETYPPFLLK
jgi:CRISPR-associated protein Cas1